MQVKWISDGGNLIGYVSVPKAAMMVREGNFVGKCGSRRVYHIKRVDKRHNPWVPSYRVGRAMLQPIPVTSKTVRLWDRHFKMEEVRA